MTGSVFGHEVIKSHDDGGGGGGPPCGKGPHPACPSVAAAAAKATWAEVYGNEADMFDAADLVVSATVLNGSTFDRLVGRADRALPVSQVILQVADNFKGASRRVIILEQTRGPGLEILDDPGYVRGDDYVLYLRQIGANTFRTVNPDGRIRQ